MTTSERWGGFSKEPILPHAMPAQRLRVCYSKEPVGRAAPSLWLVLLVLGALAFTAATLSVVPW